jgi:uncharacterized protein with PIN domain
MTTAICPLCKKQCETVSSSKVYGSVKKHFNKHIKSKEYGFCTNPHCDIVYFGTDENNSEMYFNRDFDENIK